MFRKFDYLIKDPTPEEAAEILSQWRSAYPVLADWSKTLTTARQPSQPEYQELPASKDADHLAMQAYCKAAAQLDSARKTMRLTDQYNAATEPLLILVGEMDFSEYESRILAWFGDSATITYDDYAKMQRDLLDAGITITVVKGPQSSGKSTMILDLESGGGILSGFHDRQMGEMISQQLAKECAYEPGAEAHWETLRDRRHGRRKQRGKGKRK